MKSAAAERLARGLGLELQPAAQALGWVPRGAAAAAADLESSAPKPRRRLDDLQALRPRDEAELVNLVQQAARERLRLLPLGGGTHVWSAPWPASEPEPDLAIDLTGVSGIVAHEIGDGTLTARAGTPLRELERAVRAAGQHLTPALGTAAAAATLGGALAAGQNGWERLRYGPARHHLLGARLLLANGDVVQSGGRLVKNVTGYDLHRLFVGSQGTLGILLEATLRLFPRPKLRARLVLEGLDEEAAFQRALALRSRNLGLEHLAIGDLAPGRVRVVAQLAGSAAGLEADLESALEVLPGARTTLDPAEPESPWALGAGAGQPAAGAWLEVSGLPSHGLTLWRAIGSLRESLHLAAPRVCQAGLMSLALLQPVPPRATLERLNADLPRLVGAARWLTPAAAGLRALAHAPIALPLRQRIEQALDPAGLFPKGRLHPAADSRP